jgi:hypothetical protein
MPHLFEIDSSRGPGNVLFTFFTSKILSLEYNITKLTFDLFCSWRRERSAKRPTVQWSGIQNVLEQAESDVLILLDCCHAGTATASEGNGVTELISACAYNSQANGVGSYSFTKELIIELQQLSQKPSFTVAELYRNIFCRIQSRRPEDEDQRERHPAPIHLSLTQDHPRFPRTIQICPDTKGWSSGCQAFTRELF